MLIEDRVNVVILIARIGGSASGFYGSMGFQPLKLKPTLLSSTAREKAVRTDTPFFLINPY